jgi:YtxH-like protein
MKRDTRNNLLKTLMGAGLYLLDPLRDRLADRIDDISDRAQDTYESAADRVSSIGDRLRGRQSDSFGNIGWMLLGVGVGVGVGMLLAPASGEETRNNLADKVHEVGDRVRTRFSSEPRPASGTYGE